MNSFVSSPAPAATPPGTMLDCGPFWPVIDVNHFRDSQRIGGTLITDTRVSDALMNAVITVDGDLFAWRVEQEAAAHATLADIPSAQIGGKSRLERLWQRAVYAHASAELRETHGDVTATGAGQGRAEWLDMSADDYRRNAIHAIRDILGETRTAVELI